MHPDIVRLDRSQIDAAGALLASAFQDDPLQTFVLPDPAERIERSPAHFATLVRHGFLFGEVFTDPQGEGVAVWMPPPDPGRLVEDYAASGMNRLADVLGRDAHLRFGRVLDYLGRHHGAAAPPRAWYLMVVGVSPARRRRGLGRALLQPICERADADHLPCCLETSQPDNRSFYESLGFRVTIETTDPTSGVRFWSFQRDPH